MHVEVAEQPPAGWDASLDAFAQATAWHRAAAVGIGREAFGLDTFYLCARDHRGDVAGVLPLVEQSSALFGKFLTSLPFVNYGGILARDPEAVAALAATAAQLGKQRGAKHVELRHSGAGPALDWPCRLDKVSMILSLPATTELLAKQLGSKLRSQIKRAERENPEVTWGGAELLARFHSVFAPLMRDLGTPVYPLSFFQAALRALGELSRVMIISAAGRDQAAAIVVRHADRLEVPWAAAGAEAKRRALNMRMYWELLTFAVRTGSAAFDFGRCTVDSGTHRFKKQWGAQELQLRWHYALPPGQALPMLNAHNPKFRLVTAAWRRLPLWAANRVGPMLIRHLP